MNFIALQRAKLHYVFENIFHVVERLVSKKEAEMNKIFKVIWSKSKQCYVVVSELAKNTTGKKKIVVASVFAALAMMGAVQDISANSYSAGGGTTGAVGNDHIAIGNGASAPGTGSNGANTAIGKRATASGGNDTAVGVSSSATGNGSSAYGQSANASGSGSVAIGYMSESSGRRAVALGGDANGTKVTASAEYATAIGSGAQAKDVNATALGANSTAIDEATIAIGKNATAGNTAFLATGAIAIGDTAIAERLDSVAIGKSTAAKGIASTAIGENAQADKDNDNALGNNVHARGGGSSAVGYLVNTSGNQAFGAGSNTTVSGTAAVGIGYMNKASGDRAISIGADDNGKNNTASGDASIAIGKAANAGGTTAAASSIAIGDNAAASGVASTAVGKAALADKDNDSSFGNSSHASGGGSSAIGYLVTTSGNQAFGAGSFTTVSGPAAVGIGYSNEVIGDRAVAIGSALDGVKTGVSGNYGVAIGAAARAKNLEATAIGKKALSSGQSAIAIGSDTSSVGNYAISIGVEANASKSDAIAVGRKSTTSGDTAMSLGYKAGASGDYSSAVGQEANSSALNSLALGRKANASLANAVALGSNSTTATNATSEGSVTIGGKNITWMGGVLNSANTPVGMQVSVGASGAERQIKNVAAGKVDATSTDAINGSQLYAVADVLRTKYVSINSTISNNQNNDGATGSNSVAIGPDAAATKADSVAMGRSVKANGQQSIAVGKSAEAKQDYNVAIGSEVVADGDNSVAMGRYASSTGTAALAIGAYGNNKSTASGNYSIAIGRDVTASGVDSIATGRDSKATAEKALAYGANAQALATNSIAIGADSQANVEKGIALGAGSKANVASGVAGYNANTENIARTDKYSGLTGVALNSNLGALSVGVTDASGAATSTRQIVGVAAGQADTDAVNVAQLKSVNLAFTGNSGSGDVNLSNSKLAVEGGTDSFITTTAANKKLEINTTQGKLKTTSGTVSVDGNNGLAVAQNVADVINQVSADQSIKYKANGTGTNSVKLSDGLNFKDGTTTTATVDANGEVSFDLNTATKTQISNNTTDITANKGKIATNTTNIAANTTALARNISLGADSGIASSQSLKDGNVSFAVKGATGDYISTNMNGSAVEISTKRATINSNATTGEASVTGNDGLATAQNVADAINAATDKAKAASAWKLTTNSSTTDTTSVGGGDTVNLVNGDNIEITQDGTNKKKITVATKKDITVDSVTAKNTVTVGSGANAITLNGATGAVSGNSFTAGNTVITTTGLTSGTGTNAVSFGTNGISAGGQVISNVASGTVNNNATDNSNAANIGDVKQAVANLSQNLNITDGTHDGTVDLKNQKLNVAGANGVTATVNNQTITVGLDTDTVNATTKGIGLTGDTGSTGNKYLKDGDVSFAVTGDGSLVSTSATAAGVKVTVNSATITAGTDGTITGPTTDGVATAKNVADAINAAKKSSKTDITANTGEAANATTGNVTLTSTTAADGHTIYDVKINDKVTLGTGANAVTVDGTTGAITGKTATIGGVTVNGTANTIGGLSNTTWNGTATTGRAATEDQLKSVADAAKSNTDAVALKFTGDVAANTGSINLKDDTFGIKGDGKYISTDVNGKNVKLTVSEAEVKKSAVAAVTVSTDTTDTNNPLTVRPIPGTDGTTMEYKVTIDGTKIANKTNLSYKANNGTAKQVSLADGLDFTNGTMTTATIDDKGVVKYSVNTATITAGTDGTITAPTADGVATAKNVADAINAAKKASKTNITANTGEAANATTGNVTLTSTTAADGHTIYDVKINDKVTFGNGANAVTVDGTTGAITGKTATIGGVTVNGTANTIGGLSNTTWSGTATTGRAATEDQLKAVADSASSQKWKITADKTGTLSNQTGTKKDATVGKDETVELVAGDNLTINQNERKFTYSLNKDLKGLTSVGIGDGTTQTITFNGANKTAVIGGVTVDGANNFVTGLANTTWNGTATTGRAATEDQLKSVADAAKSNTDAVALKFTGDVAANTGSVNLKDDTFGIKGDGQYISTDVNGKNVKLTVSETAVKKSAVNAVTVSTDTTDTNNPLTITSTGAGDGSTKNYVIAIDGTKIANKTNLSYKANNGTAKQVSLADGLDFTNGTMTTATIDDKGVVKYSVNTATITAGTDGTITAPTTDGVATAKNVADAINAAKKAGKTEITANTGEAANATTGNIKLSSTTEADGHTKYDVKLNDTVTLGTGTNAVTIDGTAGKATIGTSVIDGVNNTFTTGGANSVKLDGASGTVTGLTNKTLTVPGFATQGRAATEEQLKVVADQASKNAAASATEVTVNGGNQANVTSGNLLLTKTTDGTDGHAKFDIKLNDKVEFGTGNDKITVDGTSGTITAKNINASGDVNAKNVTTTADVTAGGTVTGNTLKAGNVTVNGGSTNTITGLSNTTWTGSTTTPDRAATEGQLQQAINSAASSATFKFDGDNNSQQTMNLQNGTFKVTGDTMITTNATSSGVGLSLNTNNVKIAYAANGTNGQTTSLASGFNFTDGDHTKATVATNGVVKYDAKTSTISVANGHATSSGNDLATADNVADAINQMTQNNAGNTTQLRQEISKVATETQRVGAHAAAMAALKPIQYDPLEPTQIMAGVGNYRGETAAALGLAHYTNENTMFNVGVSVGGNHNMVNAGVTHKFGYSPEKKNVPDRYKAGPISSIYVMQDEMTQLRSENEAYKAKLDKQQSEIDALKAAVDQLLASKA